MHEYEKVNIVKALQMGDQMKLPPALTESDEDRK